MTLADFHCIAEEDSVSLCSLQLAAERRLAPKLPFDINDYCNFELNEDFISSSAGFLNDYSSSFTDSAASTHGDYDYDNSLDSHHALRSEIEHQLDNISPKGGEFLEDSLKLARPEPRTPPAIDELHVDFQSELTMDDLFEQDDYLNHRGYSQSADIAPPPFPDFLSSRLASGKAFADQSHGFKIFDYTHRDFQCGVPTRQKTPCKNKITCTFHTILDKSKISRTDTVLNLIRNFKYLQELQQSVYEYSKPIRKRSMLEEPDDESDEEYSNDEDQSDAYSKFSGKHLMKRHNSYHSGLNEANLDDFIVKLQSKLSEIKSDPIERLLDFQYRQELKNFAVVEYYKSTEHQS